MVCYKCISFGRCTRVTQKHMNVYISKEMYNLMCQYILATDLEISGFGKVERINGDLHITDIKIFEQEVTGGTTDLDLDNIAKFLMELNTAGEDPSKYKLWWHSHNTMSAFFSGTDTSTIDELGMTFDWLVAIVGNHDQEFKTRVDLFYPTRHTEEAQLMVLEDRVEVSEEIKKEVEEKVKEKTYTPATYVGTHNSYQPNLYKGDHQNKKGKHVLITEEKCIERGGVPIFDKTTGKFDHCWFAPAEKHLEDMDYDEVYETVMGNEPITAKETTMVEQRVRYYKKNPNIFKQHTDNFSSLCGGYKNCDNLIDCEFCLWIEEIVTTEK